MRGVLNVNKPSGITSYDVIRRLKPVLGRIRIGHAGTLDPIADGVLLILLGAATKIADLLQAREKEYLARVRVGVSTDTDDITGRVIAEKPPPPLSEAQLTEVLRGFEGEISQTPPAYSALKLGGVRAYDIARSGDEPQLSARPVLVRNIELVAFAGTEITFRAVVSKGTYIRALARDIGDKLGCGATLQALTRTRAGDFRIETARPLDELQQPDQLQAALVSIDEALAFLPLLHVKPEAVVRLRNGQLLVASEVAEPVPQTGTVRVMDPDGKVLVISECQAGRLKPRRGIYRDAATPD